MPVTLALTLFVYYALGYTLNRITLFALIFSIGILVDDAIVVVENIYRHSPREAGPPLATAAVDAVDEVGNPTILATFTVIAAILPMAFVSRADGPVHAPDSGRRLGGHALLAGGGVHRDAPGRRHPDLPPADVRDRRTSRRSRRALVDTSLPPDHDAARATEALRLGFYGGIVVLCLLVARAASWRSGSVKVKMLPFDNKSEFQVILDHAEGTPLERRSAARRMTAYLRHACPR